MKHLPFILVLFLGIASCKPTSKTDAPTSPEAQPTVMADTSPVDTARAASSTGVVQKKDPYRTRDVESTENQVDTSNYDPGAVPSKKYESPKVNPNITSHTCSPNFNVLSRSQNTTHFYYVTGFKPDEFKCWAELEKHGTSICNEQPCTIYYFDSPNVKISTASGNQIDANSLMKYGIGKFEHTGKFWEVNGARKWKRMEKGYGYYNTNNHLGG